MPQPQERNSSPIMLHLICPTCLAPMRIRFAEVDRDGKEKIQFTCDNCGTETVRESRSKIKMAGSHRKLTVRHACGP
jgi:hypothetical protein